MTWPTSQDFNEAIQTPRLNLQDPELRSGEPALSKLGMPIVMSGSFADVYKIHCAHTGHDWAVKCFTRQVPDQQDRYRKISDHLKQSQLPFTVGFHYLPEGIRVRGQWFPIVKMHWVEGASLNAFVGDNLRKPQTLETLAQLWAKLAQRLRDAGLAHADLQHGNVLLVSDGTGGLKLKLIDYDGMFVPALGGTSSGECGHANYQHPLRLKHGFFNAGVDRFPHLVIGCALRALTVGGQALWDRYDNGDNLLFKQKDFEAPQDSALLRELWRSPDALTKCLAGHLIRAQSLPVGQEPFWPDLVGSNPPLALSAADERAVQAVLNRPGTRPATTPPKIVVPSPKLSDASEITLPGGVKLKQIWCPSGTFRRETPGARGKKSSKEVTLTSGFWLGQTVVTQAMWTAVMGPASKPWFGRTHVKEGPNFPATYISHGVNPDGTVEAESATAFCDKLTEIERQAGRLPTGWTYALPTEAQWEYACRAGTTTAYSFGDKESSLSEYAWFDKNAYDVGEKYAHAVGTKKPNPWGLYDMHGNVWEWCGGNLSGGTNPAGHATGSDRVRRGGSWGNSARRCESAYCGEYAPSYRECFLGFRLCLSSRPIAVAPPTVQPANLPSHYTFRSGRWIAVAPSTVQPANPAPPKLVVPSQKLGDTLEITLPGGVKLKQIWCPSGTFRRETPGARGKKSPKEVTLTKGFWLGQTVVTQAMWTAVMGTASKPWSGKTHVKEGPNFPASYISHGVNLDRTVEADSATAFCDKLTEIERQAGRLPSGWKYALPTEAQWEYACRAGTTTKYSFGDNESKLSEYAWFMENAFDIGEKYAHAVGTKKPNPWGLSDMHGNVWEWCRDGYADKIVGGTNPVGPKTGSRRVGRGGGWCNSAGNCLSACRSGGVPSNRFDFLGFRVCLSSD